MAADYFVPADPRIRLREWRLRWIAAHTSMPLVLLMMAFLIFFAIPLAFALVQGRLLRAFGSWRWGVATGLGIVAGMGAGGGLWTWMDDARIPGAAALLIGMSVVGLCVGTPQWWLLRRAGGVGAWRWPPASAAGWALLGACYMGPFHPLLLAAPRWLSGMAAIALLMAGGALYGAITGAAMIRILGPEHLSPAEAPSLPHG
ncbi:MAG TPA: hypothetical protein VGE07_23885 [Herpetosiphonaceae bacterium]